MSSPEEGSELRAGHPPAVKVGGKRVAQHKPDKPGEPVKRDEPHKSDTDGAEAEEQQEPPQPATKPLIISGAVTRGDADFPPEAIKAFHEKPIPSHEFRPANHKQPSKMIIHQPKK